MNKIHFLRNAFAVLVIAGIGAVSYISHTSIKPLKVEAGSGDNVTGYAWSDTIGWISFNSTNESGATASYGVSVDTANKAAGGTGDFSGVAWSDTVGWISFNRADTGTPPATPFNGASGSIAQVDWSTGKVTGWARALSAVGGSGGWDGWIKLAKHPSDTGATYGVSIDASGKLSGYAWGGAQVDASGNSIPGGVSVIGWIDFAPATAGAKVVQVSLPITWNIAAGAGVGGTITPSGAVSVAQGNNQTFTVAANSGYGIASLTIDGNPAPAATSYTFPNVQANHTISANFSTLCVNGAMNHPVCTIDAAGQCLSGALNPPTCTIMPCNNNGVCNTGETITTCPSDCKIKYQQF